MILCLVTYKTIFIYLVCLYSVKVYNVNLKRTKLFSSEHILVKVFISKSNQKLKIYILFKFL